MSSAARNAPFPDGPDLADRCLRAARICWEIENNSVILLQEKGPGKAMLRGQLQALGLDVFDGADCADIGPSPVIVIEARNWQRPEMRRAATAIRRGRPEAAICVLSGLLSSDMASHSSNNPVFDDARALLQAAGFGFFSISGGDHAHPA